MKVAIYIAKLLLVVLLVAAGFLLIFQHRMIYFPRPYGTTLKVWLPVGASELAYSTSEGVQCAFYLPAANPEPKRIWVAFGGNSALALDWCDFVKRDENHGDAFLLVDYPGYGKCQGTASPDAIAESGRVAMEILAKKLGRNPAELHWNVIGHSLGCGAALEFAVQRRVERVVLAAPFTSLRAMAQRTVGFPLCFVLLHNFDNRARLAELAKSAHPPLVTVFHGSADEVIPVDMSRSLAREFPELIKYHEIAGAEHNTIMSEAERDLLQAMNQGALPGSSGANGL